MIDLHCHLLHGLDDGPECLDESLQLCRLAVEDGITHAIVTPHVHPGRWENSPQGIRGSVSELRSALGARAIPLGLGFAGEVRLSDQVMRQIQGNEIPFYGAVGGYKIMLLEFPHGQLVPGSEKLTQWLMDNGVRPLIAHPERNRQVMKDVSQLRPFLESGCWLQLTAGSVVGAFGARAQAVARELLDADVVAVLASDGHNADARPPQLKVAFDFVAANYGLDRARKLMIENPGVIVADQFPVPQDLAIMADAVISS